MKAVINFWEQLRGRGHIQKGKHAGFYSSVEEAFVPKNEVLFDYAKKKHVHMKSGSIVETNEETNYLFNLGEWKGELKKLWSGPDSIRITERFRHQVLTELKDLPEVPT